LKLDLDLSPCTKINSKWIIVKPLRNLRVCIENYWKVEEREVKE
jgi:hypothetical protein